MIVRASISLLAFHMTPARPPLALTPCHVASVPVELRCGTFEVYEDRDHGRGRRIPLFVRVIPSASPHPAPDPLVFVSAGGPGLTNSDILAYPYLRGWRQDRDVVVVDLRGTSGPRASRLDCATPGSQDHPAGYLESPFESSVVARCRAELSRHADLRFYTTRLVVEDLHEVLAALGYEKVDLWGASGGTREVLDYVRRHPDGVRAAIVEGVAPVSFKNPLPHAEAAQEALDSLFAQCARDASCHGAFPSLEQDFQDLKERLGRRAVEARVPSQLGGVDSVVEITWSKFAEVVREMSYTPPSERAVPYVVHHAASGDFAPLITYGVAASRRTRDAIRFGFLLSQTCTEDVPRITDAEVAHDTRGTYLGDVRVREQRAACRLWPHGDVSPSDFTPVRSSVPVFMLAGTIDPVTRPFFARDAARYLPNSTVVIAPGGHVPSGACVDAMERQFLNAASVSGLDTSCVAAMRLPPFRT